jgi:hypothetical protein
MLDTAAIGKFKVGGLRMTAPQGPCPAVPC